MKVTNSTVVQTAQKVFAVQNPNEIPSDYSKTIVPCAEVNPIITSVCQEQFSSGATNATSATVVTLDTKKQFYLTHAIMSVSKDATATSTQSWVYIKIGGKTIELLAIQTLSLSAAQGLTMALTFPRPIKLDKGSTVSVNNATATANISAFCAIGGFYDNYDYS